MPWWVVVNEAVDDTPNNGHPFDMRDNFWLRKLGRDYVKYAFIFAQEADPNLKLYYNDYNAEGMSRKSDQVFELAKWLKSEGARIHGIGLQWHIDVSTTVEYGDQHYQNAQRLIAEGFDIMVTELDVSILMDGLELQNPNDLHKQGLICRAMVKYAIHCMAHCRALTIWGFTDRYSWIPHHSRYQKGIALPFDWAYEPKFAFQQMQEELGRVLADGVYRIAPRPNLADCLEAKKMNGYNAVQINQKHCSTVNQTWNITWQADGTYRISPLSRKDYALDAFMVTEKIGGIQTYPWWRAVNQRWIFSTMHGNKYRLAPHSAWWRALTFRNPYGVVLADYRYGDDQHWVFVKV